MLPSSNIVSKLADSPICSVLWNRLSHQEKMPTDFQKFLQQYI